MRLKTLPVLALLSGAALLPLHAQDTSPAPPAGAKGKPITEVAHFDRTTRSRASPCPRTTGFSPTSRAGPTTTNTPWPRWARTAASKPYPDEQWNSWKDKDPDRENKFVCVQSVVVDDTGALWVLDTGNPGMNGTLAGGPKLVKIDLTTNQVVQKIPFGADICPAKSYLNDVRFDTGRASPTSPRAAWAASSSWTSRRAKPAACWWKTSPRW